MVRWLVVPCAVLVACARKDPPPKPGPAVAPSVRASASAKRSNATASALPAPPPPAPTSVKVELETDGGLPGLSFGELADVGPAGPATAFAGGVALLTRRDQILETRLTGPSPARSKLPPVTAEQADLAPVGRGPAVAGGM